MKHLITICASALQLCALDLVLASYQDPLSAYEALEVLNDIVPAQEERNALQLKHRHDHYDIVLENIPSDDERTRIAQTLREHFHRQTSPNQQALPPHQAIIDFTQNRFGEAYAQLQAQKKEHALDRNLQFYFARSAFELGKLDEAIDGYEALLLDDPHNRRVTLELARSHFLSGNHPRAKALFETVLEEDIPTEVRDNITHYLHRMRGTHGQHNLSFLLQAGAGYDDNVYNHTYLPNTAYGDLTLRNDTDADADALHRESALLQHAYRFAQSALTWHSTLTAYNQSYATRHDMDVVMLGLKSGALLRSNDLRVALPLELQQVWLGGESYLSVPGFHPSVEWLLDKSHALRLQGSLMERQYQRQGESRRNARIAEVSLSSILQRENGDLFELTLFATAERKRQKERLDISRNIFGADTLYRLKMGPLWYLNTNLHYARHHYLDQDPQLDRRVDHYMSASAALGRNITSKIAFELTCTHMRDFSNIEIYTYNKNRFMANLLYTY